MQKQVLLYRLIMFLPCIFMANIGFAQNQACPVNINFADGALNHWFAYTGTFQQNTPRDVANKQVYDSTSAYPTGTIGTQSLPEYIGGGGQGVRVLTTNSSDLFGGFATIPTINGYNYKYSVLLGSTSVNSSPGGFFRGIGYEVDVPAGTGPYTMTYAYAMVLENGNHESVQQPLASATLSTANGIIDCASPKYFLPTSGGVLDQAAAIANGFKQSQVPTPNTTGSNNSTPYRVWTKDWTEVTFDLQAYRGQKVTLVFTAENCVPKGHFAYAYFAIRNECNGLTISGPADACENGNVTYSIPSLDGASYNWTVPGGWTITAGSGTNIITVKPGIQPGTISVRAVNSCADLSASLFVQSSMPTIAGTINGNNIVCEGINNSPITLTGNNGSVVKWISSTDNGQSWNDVSSISSTYNAQNLSATTLFKALVQNGTQCSIDSTNSVIITVDAKSKGGDLYPSVLPICLGQNQNTTLQLQHATGNPINWQYSYDSIVWNNVTPTYTSKSYQVNNITSTVKYRVIVKNGICPVDTSLVSSIYFYNAYFPQATAYPDSSNICFGTAATLNANVTIGSNYYWNTNTVISSGNGSITNLPYSLTAKVAPSKTTNYILTIKNGGCPTLWTDTFKVNVIPPVVVDAGHDTSVVVNQPLQLKAIVADSSTVSFNWSPSTGLNNPNIGNPIATLNGSVDSIKYTVRATLNNSGCYGEDAVWVKIFKTEPDIFVPSAFTPNKDGLNDIIKPIPVGIATLNYFSIYNRWGQLLYNTSEISKGWDGYVNGTAQPAGTYVYIAEGVDYKGKTIFKKGTVVLIK